MDFISRLKRFFTAAPDPVEIDKMLFCQGDYMGPYAASPNGRWVVSWRDADPAQSGQVGAREAGEGDYLLFDKQAQRVVVRGRAPRPYAGQVADNGTFCFEDRDFGSSLSGTLRVFGCNGQALALLPVTANIMKSCLSPNGAYALIHTAHSPSDDGVKLILLDVLAGELRYRVPPLAGWADRYEIEEATGVVIAHLSGLGKFRYGPDGDFIDEEKLQRAMLDSPRYEHSIPAAAKLLEQPDLTEEMAREALRILIRARKHGADWADSWNARSLKLIGQAHEALGEIREAIEAYNKALDLDPKIGVKRKRDSLQKRI